MADILHLFWFVNDLIFSNLPRPDDGPLAPPHDLDEDATVKENALNFYLFEVAITMASGISDQLNIYAAGQETASRDQQQRPKQDDQVWDQIQNQLKDEVLKGGLKIRVRSTKGAPVHKNVNNSMTKITEYMDTMAKTGLPDNNFQVLFSPASANEWEAVVERRTRLNTLLEWWSRTMFSPSSPEPTLETETLQQAAGEQTSAEILYKFLAARPSCAKTHSAMLQLSGFNNPSEGNTTFQMYLSCSSNGTLKHEMNCWHRTTCTFERLEPRDTPPTDVDVCSEARDRRSRHVPLLLSFDSHHMWITSSSRRSGLRKVLLEHEENPTHVSLEALLSGQDLKTSDLDGCTRKYRLALRLALSLHSLHSGPWIQQDWTSSNIYITRNKRGELFKMLDEAYISCIFDPDWRRAKESPKALREHASSEFCPRFFLSLAQLLVDIANGDRDHRPHGESSLNEWYEVLVKEVRNNNEDQLMKYYWDAIEGCILYSEIYESHDSTDEKLRAQDVIDQYIVRPLRENLNFWEEERQKRRPMASDESSHSHDRAIAQCSPSAGVSVSGSKGQQTIDTEFSLWSNQDNDYQILITPTTQPKANSFISHMNQFTDKFIAKLPKGDNKVRVAIIDSGLFLQKDDLGGNSNWDPFLQNPNVQLRVKDKQSFFSPDDNNPNPDDWEDRDGHGTQVARLVLRFAPRAEVVIAKVTDSKTLKQTKIDQLVKALRWAGERADIINLSFSLGKMPNMEVQAEIKDLVTKKKLVFAAASNTGAYGSRMYPARGYGVFAIHATDEFGVTNAQMNPEPLSNSNEDNFATFGCNVDSYWKGHYRSISGTSFATPVAAAIAADILEIARRTLDDNVLEKFASYGSMRALFREHMTENNGPGVYHCFRPWIEGLWDGYSTKENIIDILWQCSI